MATKKHHIVEFAFHMPITEAEHREYMAIKKLVRLDQYLPPAYRDPKRQPPIVDDPKKYVNGLS